MRKLAEFLGGDYTALEHGLVAIGMQMSIYGLFHWYTGTVAILIGAAFSIAFFCGREHAQETEYLKRRLGANKITWAMTLETLKFWQWKWGSQIDLYVPVVCCIIMTWIFL